MQAAGPADNYALARWSNQKVNPKASSSSPHGTSTHPVMNPGSSLGLKDCPYGNLIRNGRN